MFPCLCFTLQPLHLLFQDLVSLSKLQIALFCFTWQPLQTSRSLVSASLRTPLQFVLPSFLYVSSLQVPFIICWWFNVEPVRVSDGAYPTTRSY
jgi:hypothetical protein